MRERLLRASNSTGRRLKVQPRTGGVAMEIDRQKRNKMAASMDDDGAEQDNGHFSRTGGRGMKDGGPMVNHGASAAKRYRTAAVGQDNLTGAQVEPRQEQ